MTCFKTLNSFNRFFYMSILSYNNSLIYYITNTITCCFCHLPCSFSYCYKNNLTIKFSIIKCSLNCFIRKNCFYCRINYIICNRSQFCIHKILLPAIIAYKQYLQFYTCQLFIIMYNCTVVAASISIVMQILHYFLNLCCHGYWSSNTVCTL